MWKSRFIILLIFLFGHAVQAQLDSLQHLDEVFLTDSKLENFWSGFTQNRIGKSSVERNSFSLTEVLQYNSFIYFKENGAGMVSSPSFRGTNAAQTAVIWNGININSHFTGQTDFNVIAPGAYDEIIIRSGGGGVGYGSGAVGGSVHLNNTFSFGTKKEEAKFHLGYGSFETTEAGGEYTLRSENFYLNAGTNFISSKNDYPYLGTDMFNTHGEYLRFGTKMNMAKKFGRGRIGWNSEYVYNDRNFSGSLTTLGKDGYKDYHTRNLVQYELEGTWKSTTGMAHVFEEFRYYPNKKKGLYDTGRAHTLVANTALERALTEKIRMNAKAEYSFTDAEGDNTGAHKRNTLALLLLWNHKLLENLDYGLNLRREFLNDFDNPLLFSADALWKVNSAYHLRINGSKNYRVPTFNDLFWVSGGNPHLNPETSYQAEVGQEVCYKSFVFDLSVYYIHSKDMIKWVPVTPVVWKPENIARAENKGVEFRITYAHHFRDFGYLHLNAGYSYTDASDVEKNKQLIYVPYHTAHGLVSFETKKTLLYSQFLYNGPAFTTTDNSAIVDGYQVVNAGFGYQLSKTLEWGGAVKNIFNVYYENVAYRPMPSRNIQLYINFNIY
ncbi:MAG TPA: TonB-dependent receptor [Flavobacteriaceae bacterium]|nr:TonB-dependent receptor [Flavobacteriaceae bacterium]